MAQADKPADDMYIFNRKPLAPKRYSELPLGQISPRGWIRDELKRQAEGMTGHLDEWWPEVPGPRNAWLGGDGANWERGPYWIDGLYPLSRLLDDKKLIDKAKPWVEWTLENQREDGYIGPRPPEDKQAGGGRNENAQDWWPRMIMLKILQQHYLATGDERVIDVLTNYFRYQLETLPDAPLQAGSDGRGGSWWARQRGGDNIMVVLWLYNITGEPWLLELSDLLYQQTLPWSDIFLEGEALRRQTDQPGNPYGAPLLHCVNLAMGMKTPVIRFQQDKKDKHLKAVKKAFRDLDNLQGQPHGLYGADEMLHGPGLDRGSELCTAVEMMFSLEKMLEITGDVAFADRLERIAFNALPTQVSDDHHTRMYYQQANQVMVTRGNRSFHNDGGVRLVYGLLQGCACCTANYHQGWPKFAQHLWMASADGGLAAMIYGPSQVTGYVDGGTEITIVENTNYPFEETIRFTIETARQVQFPLHLRIPGWCRRASIKINGQLESEPQGDQIVLLNREWQSGDVVELELPMYLRRSQWYERSAAVERGPLVYALRIKEKWSEVKAPAPDSVPEDAMHRGYREVRPADAWNYALYNGVLNNMDTQVKVVKKEWTGEDNPWNLENAPIELHIPAVRLPDWKIYRRSAGPVPRSPVKKPEGIEPETIRLIPYGATTLRITGFPWVRGEPE